MRAHIRYKARGILLVFSLMVITCFSRCRRASQSKPIIGSLHVSNFHYHNCHISSSSSAQAILGMHIFELAVWLF
jgi:hypothetical protein